MKNLIYIFSVMFLALFSCQEDILEQSIENKDSGDFAVVNFGLFCENKNSGRWRE